VPDTSFRPMPIPTPLASITSNLTTARAPCVYLNPGASDSALQRTRLGGSPFMPRDARWPRSDRGPLSFVGQLDFGELFEVHRGQAELPDAGILSFYYDVEEQPWGYDPGHAAGFALLYEPERARAIEVEPPDGAIPFDVEPLSATFGWSLPTLEDLSTRSWVFESPAQRKYYADYQAEHSTSQGGGIPGLRQQVGGHAEWLKPDGRLTAELASSGVHAGGEPRTWRAADTRRAEADAESWRLLWQLKPEDERFTWVDLGTLYVLIRAQDLSARRFERAWVVFQST
jgi:uncharacterized protein YwqG